MYFLFKCLQVTWKWKRKETYKSVNINEVTTKAVGFVLFSITTTLYWWHIWWQKIECCVGNNNAFIFVYSRWIHRHLRCTRMHWITICILSVVLLIYILIGGAIFMALEKDKEDEIATTQTSTFTQFLGKLK